MFVISDNLIALKILRTKTNNYEFSKKKFDDLNSSFSKSFFNDISNFYIQHLAFKHKLQKNYEDLKNNFIKQNKNLIN